MSEWKFKNGTKVKAITFTEAVDKLSRCKFSSYWAMEESPGHWTVLFQPDIELEIDGANDSFEASRMAVSIVCSEVGKEFIDVKPVPRKLKRNNCCAIFSRECLEDRLFG